MASIIELLLEGRDQGLSGTLNKATTEARALGAAAQSGGLHLGSLGKVASKASGALGHAAGQLKSIAMGPLGLIGVTGGLLAAGSALDSTLSKMNDLAFGTEKLTAITHGSAESMSTLIATTEKYGVGVDQLSVIAGFYEKTTGKLSEKIATQTAATKSQALADLELTRNERLAAGETTKKIDGLIREQTARDAVAAALAGQSKGLTGLQALEKQYGITLTDNTGKALPFDQALLNIADAYSKDEDRSKAAALASTLMGKSWQTLAPILVQGKQGILELEQQAAAMGLQLSQKNVADFAAYREAIRGSQEAISGLEVTVGEDLLPTITDVANGLSAFVVGHKQDVRNFIDGIVAEAKVATGAISGLVGGLSWAWSQIPAPLRDALLTGAVGDRTIKFLFGFSPIGSIASGIESGFANAIGKGLASAGLGKLFVQPVFVTNPGFGGPQLPGGPTQTAEDTGLFATLKGLGFKAAVALAAVPLAMAAVADFIQTHAPDTKDFNHIGILDVLTDPFGKRDAYGYTPGDPRSPATQAVPPPSYPAPIGPGTSGSPLGGSTPTALPIGPGTSGFPIGSAQDMAAALISFRAGERDFESAVRANTAALTKADWLKRLQESWMKAGQTMHDKIREAMADVAAGRNIHGAAQFLGAKLGNAGFGAGGYDQAIAVLKNLKDLHTTDPAVVAAIRELEARLPRLKDARDDLAAAVKIAQGSDPKNKKLDELNALMADLRAHGDKTAQKKLGDIIAAVKAQKNHFTSNTTLVVDFYGVGGAGSTIAKRAALGTHWTGSTALAEGGRYRAGGARLVGERGMELDVPDRAGTIVNHNDTAALSRFLDGFLTPAAPAGDQQLRQVLEQLRGILATLARGGGDQRLLVAAYATARDTEAAANRRAALGPSRTRQGAIGTRG